MKPRQTLLFAGLAASLLPAFAPALADDTSPSSRSADERRVDDERLPEARRLARYIADKILDGMEDRTWLVAPGLDHSIAAELRAAAKLREAPLFLVDSLDASTLPDDVRSAIDALGPEFSDAIAITPFLFARLWMERDRDAALRQLALGDLPALWKASGAACVPSGLVFLGVPAVPDANALAARFSTATDFWDDVGERLLDSELEPSTAEAVELRSSLRRRASLAANILGTLLDGVGKREEAFEAYARAQRIDRENLSALMNRASAVRRGVHPESQADIVAELNRRNAQGFDEKATGNLALQFGPVVHPEDFVPFGWAWALTGVAYGDEAALKAGIEALPENARAPMGERLKASLAAQIARTDGGLTVMKMLADSEKRAAACLAVAKSVAGSGDADGAASRLQDWLDRAKAAGATDADCALVRFESMVARGDIDGAKAFLRDTLVTMDPPSPILWRNLVNMLAAGGDADGLAEAVGHLAEAREAHTELGGIHAAAEGMLLVVRQQPEAARAKLVEALEAIPGDPTLLTTLLRLDFQFAGQDPAMREAAREHATALVAIVPSDAFANYILGSLAFSDGDFETAARQLARSVATDAQPYALNDLACALNALGRHEEALKAIEAALKAAGDDPAMIDTYAESLIGLGRWDDAQHALFRARSLPGGADLPSLRLREAAIYLHKGDTPGASAALRAIEPLVPQFAPSDKAAYDALRKQLDAQ